MYFTIFYQGERDEFSIIHEHPARQYAEDLATYENYVQVNQKPTLEESAIIFRIVKAGTLNAGISSARTEKLQ